MTIFQNGLMLCQPKTVSSSLIFVKDCLSPGCFEIQINDQGHELVKDVNTELHKFIDVEQILEAAYHSQSNRLLIPK